MEQPRQKFSFPLPRGLDEVPQSEVMPFKSKKVKLLKSPAFYLIITTGALVICLFVLGNAMRADYQKDDAAGFLADFRYFVLITIFLIVMMIDFGIHAYCHSDKPQLFILPPFLFVVIFLRSPLWNLIYPVFESLSIKNDSLWIIRMWDMFTGPGLREELVKALPALFGAFLAMQPAKLKWLPDKLREWMIVRSPLDGLLIGIAAGGAFTFSETGWQYVDQAFAGGVKLAHGDFLAGAGSGIMLVIPRALGDLGEHSAYSGIFGYFIGLAVLYPKSALRLMLIGWGVAAVLHGFWDSDFFGIVGITIDTVVISTLFVFCMLKARQIEMTRFKRGLETFGSIVVGLEQSHVFAPVPATPPPVPAATPVQGPAQVAAPVPAAHAATRFTLASDTGRTAVSSTTRPDFAAIFAGGAAEVKAEALTHPSDPSVLGLRNLGSHSWYARLANNSIQQVEPGKTLKLVAGTSIDFGGGLVARVLAE